MVYHTLQIYKYEHHLDFKQLKKAYRQKLNSNKTVVTNLHYFINGYSFPLFYTKLPELSALQQRIYQNSINIMEKISKLNSLEQHEFYIGNLCREIVDTNKIEGLYTTPKEIESAIYGILNHVSTSDFQPFAKMYLLTNQRKHLNITHLKDIRNIYNQLFKNLFPEHIFPQSTLFRNSPIRIGNSFSTAYQPKSYEKEFISNLKEWLKFINNKHCSPLIKACIAHFFFECIHPFNDGNGRTGRYILSTYLASKIDKYTATTFAQEIEVNKKLYYKAFQTLDNVNVFGDVTLFIISMFKIILNSQKGLLKDLHYRIKMNNDVKKPFEKLAHNKLEQKIIDYFLAVQLFNDNYITLSISQIKARVASEYSRYKIRTALKDLHHVGKNNIKLMYFTKTNPLKCRIDNGLLYLCR